MSDPLTRLNAALAGRYAIESPTFRTVGLETLFTAADYIGLGTN